MIFIVYCPISDRIADACSGLPDMARYRALQSLLPILREAGEVRQVDKPDYDVDSIRLEAEQKGLASVFLSFTLPHQTLTTLRCPTVAVFDWPYDTMPDEPWPDESGKPDARHDWPEVLRKIQGVITHSEFTASTVRRFVGEDYPVISIAHPVWDDWQQLAQHTSPVLQGQTYIAPVPFLDSAELDLGELAPVRNDAPLSAMLDAHSSETFKHGSFTGLRRFLKRLSVGRSTSLDAATPSSAAPAAASPQPLIQNCSANLRQAGTAQQHRDQFIDSALQSAGTELTLHGTVYAARVNPLDSRALYDDLISAFCRSFAARSDAVLLLNLEHRDLRTQLHAQIYQLYKLYPFSCRVVLLIGTMSDEAWRQVLQHSAFFLHVTRGEGQCPMLLQSLSAGRPVIAQPVTAMQEYVSAETGFPFASTPEITWWPHDPRTALRARHARVDWESLCTALSESYQLAQGNAEAYAALSSAAATQMRDYCSRSTATKSLQDFLQLPALARHIQPGEVPDLSGLKIDPRMVGLVDTVRNGWFNRDTGELCPGFAISAQDTLLDFGCGHGSAALFAADQAAHIIACDTDKAKMEQLIGQLRESPAASWRALLGEYMPLPLAEGCASRVVAMEVLEHLQDPLAVLRELVRVGRSGALYLLSVPDERSEGVQQKLAPAEHFQAPNHVQVFSRGGFEHLVVDAGLKIESRQYTGFFWSMWFSFFWAAQQRSDHVRGMPTHDQIQPPYAPLLQRWADVWWEMMRLPDGETVRRALDETMPKSQIIIARKP